LTETADGRVVTFGKLVDGGILVTSSFHDVAKGTLQVSSLLLSTADKNSAILNRSEWSKHGCTCEEEQLIDEALLQQLLPPLPKLVE
jgi:hypothetical protein